LFFTDRKKISQNNFQSILKQYYCLKRVNDLKCQWEDKYNFKYDLVIRLRPDLLFLTKDQLYVDEINTKCFYTLDHDHWGGYSDRLYMSNSQNMDIISNRLELQKRYSDLGGIGQYERFLQYIVDINGIEMREIPKLQTCLLRTNDICKGELIKKMNGLDFGE
jgi:hypothetical protein